MPVTLLITNRTDRRGGAGCSVRVRTYEGALKTAISIGPLDLYKDNALINPGETRQIIVNENVLVKADPVGIDLRGASGYVERVRTATVHIEIEVNRRGDSLQLA